ncbi:U2 snRNP-associated SURP motif-containing protein-like [Cylas formicarius]|uniref:U2 snRNP-associated SURP motif-containing protein-like n=1 Tax=Cylas formicarius TaxID=197179 RepID=UPI002958B7E0|nr:U2 snRNP-associated SURP motif-containing protein-like [Cylas formicarius]
MSKRSYEKKILEEQEATAHVFQEFVNTFQEEPCSISKTFVKSGVLFAQNCDFKTSSGQLYLPKPLILSDTLSKNVLECARILKTEPLRPKKREKLKSNLETLKEELKQRHLKRNEKDKPNFEQPTVAGFPPEVESNSTNLFIANLDPKITEAELMKEFGTFGPLASVKIMWPRGDDRSRSSNTNCGFVAFMSRKDATRALDYMRNRQDMRIGWGKAVELPLNPIYIPQELLQQYLPPPPSGLPFNAQSECNSSSDTDLAASLSNSVVKVTIPFNRKVLMLVNRMVEYVIKEGPMFEAIIMNNEIGNPEYSFLFDYKSPVHVYYRWRLFSILQGDCVKNWRMEPFRMYQGGSIWVPPKTPDFSKGMPENLISTGFNDDLSENQLQRLNALIRQLSMERSSIAETMIFCVNHLTAIKSCLQIILESLHSKTATPSKLIARLYLFSDVVSNCRQSVSLAYLEPEMGCVVEYFYKIFGNIKSTLDKELFKSKLRRVLRHWDYIALVSRVSFQKWDALFDEHDSSSTSSNDEPLDGANLLKRSLKCNSNDCVIKPNERPVSQNIPSHYFVPSKWDTLDSAALETQAVSSDMIYRSSLGKSNIRDHTTEEHWEKKDTKRKKSSKHHKEGKERKKKR